MEGKYDSMGLILKLRGLTGASFTHPSPNQKIKNQTEIKYHLKHTGSINSMVPFFPSPSERMNIFPEG